MGTLLSFPTRGLTLCMEPISEIDSSTNQLFFRGINATSLAKESDYESVVYLLIHGTLPSANQRDDIKTRMIEFRDLYSKEMVSIQALARNFDTLKEEKSLDTEDALLAFVSLSAVVTANSFMDSQGLAKVKPNQHLDHAANFLWIINGCEPSNQDVNDFQSCLILHMDDPDNPSLTALSRVLGEGGSISQSLSLALIEHVSALHHGAGTEAMKMFNEIRYIETVKDYLQHRIENGNKIFGMGHRIYRGLDPRAIVLREILRRRSVSTNDDWLIQVIEEVACKGSALLAELKGIQAHPNVDLYNAATYMTFGFPPEFNTTLFALSRVAGWAAHILESLTK